MHAHPALGLLGFRVKDIISGNTGICESVCFDLYGCIQATFRQPGLTDKGEQFPGFWVDIKRLETIETRPIMQPPNFSIPEIGAADKPTR